MKTLAVLLSLVSVVAIARAVDVDGFCTGDSDCTVSNSYCSRTYMNCAKGTCECSSGFDQISTTSCTATVAKKSKGETCTVTADCDVSEQATQCSGSPLTCTCGTGYTWNSKVSKCLADGKKVISEVCTAATDCDSGILAADTYECVASTGSATLYCRCKSGYTTKDYTCLEPLNGETCTTLVGCIKPLTLGSTQETDTCQNSVCKCPTSASQHTVTYNSVSYNLCFTKYTGTLKADGQACTEHNQCASKICDLCPSETTAKTCFRTTSAATALPALSVWALLTVSVVVMGML